MTTIMLNKGGTAERTAEAESLAIPDLWHLSQDSRLGPNERVAVLECWHLAHDLKRHIIEAKPEREETTEQALSWANQQSYSGAGAALDAYCEPRGLSWQSDAMYAYVTFTEES